MSAYSHHWHFSFYTKRNPAEAGFRLSYRLPCNHLFEDFLASFVEFVVIDRIDQSLIEHWWFKNSQWPANHFGEILPSVDHTLERVVHCYDIASHNFLWFQYTDHLGKCIHCAQCFVNLSNQYTIVCIAQNPNLLLSHFGCPFEKTLLLGTPKPIQTSLAYISA